jgi:hypothetical protein
MLYVGDNWHNYLKVVILGSVISCANVNGDLINQALKKTFGRSTVWVECNVGVYVRTTFIHCLL